MARQIIWSHKAKIKLYEILDFYAKGNKSYSYSKKLYNTFIKSIKLLQKQPELGIKTDLENVRGLIILDYTIFYEINQYQIIVHAIWPNAQNPEDLTVL